MFDFSKNQSLKALDNVPKDFHGLYVEQDGEFKLNTADEKVKGAVAAILGLNSALNSERAKTSDLMGKLDKTDLTPLAEYGDTPEMIVAAFNTRLQEATKINQKDAVEKAVKDKQRELETLHKVEKEKLGTNLQQLTKQLYDRIVVADATSALAQAGAIAPELVLPHIAGQVKVEEKDGQLVALVMDDAKQPRFSGVTGKHMAISELVEEMKGTEKYKVFFKSDQKSGGGTPPQGGARKPDAQRSNDQALSGTDRIKLGLDKGQFQRGEARR